MYSKLAKRNMKRSLKDYTIYFLTLVFGVSIFYIFNSIGSQKIMMKLNEYDAINFERVNKLMGGVSIFIACILGFLIIYANNYLIKRRKKEFGIYLTLGMDNRKISKILLIETILIGLFSLVVGLILGIFLSQEISIFTASLFHVKLEKFKFMFSKEAFIKTIAYFGIMYLIVFLFNNKSIRKLQLIDLLTAGRKNEKIKIKSIKGSAVVFIIGVVMLLTSYFIVKEKALDILDGVIVIPIIVIIIGTFLFFFSLSGFLLKVVQRNKKVYLKGLNMFLVRQLNSKINTTFVSMSFVCLMLAMSITMLAGGFSITKTLNKNVDDLSQYDSSLVHFEGVKVEKLLKENNINIEDYAEKYVSYFWYCNVKGINQLGIRSYIGEDEGQKNNSNFDVSHNSVVPIMKITDFNNLMELTNKKKIELNNGEYAVFGDINGLLTPIQRTLDKKTKIKVNGEELMPSKNPVIEITITNDMNKRNFCAFIVKDELVEGLTPMMAFLNLSYKGDKTKIEKEFYKTITPLVDSENTKLKCITKEKIRADSFGFGAMSCYLSIYIGVIFLITSAVVLALQQLSESADNIERYNLLRKIGVDEAMINKTILAQIGIYFMVPLLLALAHSFVGLKVIKMVVDTLGTSNITGQLLITTLVFVIIYGGYFFVTYTGAKKMVRDKGLTD